MNILAHAFLSPDNAEVFLGNFVADHIKGNKVSGSRENFKIGIALHKEIDNFTDNNEIVKNAWKLLDEEFGLYSRIVVDIYFDYFLAKNWSTFSRYDFNKEVMRYYDMLDRCKNFVPARYLRRIVLRAIANKWFDKFKTLNGLEYVFRSVSRKVKYENNNINNAINVLLENEKELEAYFLEFFPQLIVHTGKFLSEVEIRNDDLF